MEVLEKCLSSNFINAIVYSNQLPNFGDVYKQKCLALNGFNLVKFYQSFGSKLSGIKRARLRSFKLDSIK